MTSLVHCGSSIFCSGCRLREGRSPTASISVGYNSGSRSYYVDPFRGIPRLGLNHEPKGLMKKYITYAMTAFFATIAVSIAAPDKNAMMAKETAAWQAFKDKKADDFKKVVAADFLGVYAEGVSNMKKEMDDMQKWDMKSFAMSDYNVVSAGAGTMMSSYKVTVEGTYDGKDASGTFNAGSVWRMKNGEWQAIFHTNVKQEAAAKPAG